MNEDRVTPENSNLATMGRNYTKVHKDESLNCIVCEIAGQKVNIPAEHAEEIHELLGEWLEEERNDG